MPVWEEGTIFSKQLNVSSLSFAVQLSHDGIVAFRIVRQVPKYIPQRSKTLPCDVRSTSASPFIHSPYSHLID
ncbi:unnamed protein product [Onchocerca flexuosa]|uniref:Ovule protein n=1 Tax=Onchocerca flexuosa TaxID=387005 RepID=A0A183HZ56_9BILA|nr:unnamed protein product [Onchocerca flexuosa]